MTDAQSRRVVWLVAGLTLRQPRLFRAAGAACGRAGISRFDVSIAAVGLAIGVQNAVVLALQLPFGCVSDAYSRTPVLGLSLGVGTLGAAGTALASSYAWLLAVQVVVGVGVAGHHPAHYPLLAAVSTEGTRGRGYSAHAFGGSVGLAAPFAVVAATAALGWSWRTAVGTVVAVGATYSAYCLLRFRGVDDAITRPGLAERPDGRPRLRSVPGRLAGLARTRGGRRDPRARRPRVSHVGGVGDPDVHSGVARDGLWAPGRDRERAHRRDARGRGGLILVGGDLTDRVGADPDD
ncbi:MFS transporter [Halobellus ruber]|uniref:MFS transporter n=1 Tax=Halobellus ruber TaxID=2761102 RepID=A0A7J9SI13_9EURY|nr:MFS transporter [Halobellus ruber]